MVKNIIQKSAIVTAGLGMVLAGVSFVPTAAQAKGNHGLSLGANVKAEKALRLMLADNQANVGLNADLELQNDTNNNDERLFGQTIKEAKKAFNQKVKDANTAYKNTKQAASVEFRAALKAATDQAQRITALKKYFADVMAALKVKSAAIEAAFQAFINTDVTVNQAPIVNSISGPVSIKAGQQGTWTVKATDPENQPLSYAVTWGDQVSLMAPMAKVQTNGMVQTATFTHTYVTAGTYTVTVKVTDKSGKEATTSLNVVVAAANQ